MWAQPPEMSDVSDIFHLHWLFIYLMHIEYALYAYDFTSFFFFVGVSCSGGGWGV